MINILEKSQGCSFGAELYVLCFLCHILYREHEQISGVQLLNRLRVWDFLAKGTCESQARHLTLHYFYFSVVQEDAEGIIHTCDCTCDSMPPLMLSFLPNLSAEAISLQSIKSPPFPGIPPDAV